MRATIAGFTLKESRAVFYRTVRSIEEYAFRLKVGAAVRKAMEKGAQVISIRILEED